MNQLLNFSTVHKVWTDFLSSVQKHLVEAKHNSIKDPLEEMFYPEWLNICTHVNVWGNIQIQI